MGIAFAFLLILFAATLFLSVLPWRRPVDVWVLTAIPLASVGLVAFFRLDGWPAGDWPTLLWLGTLGPGSLIAVVRLFLIALGRSPGTTCQK
ncbi:hypothetical protein ABZU76_43760 [Amycolatopsis sp. NPDC005232]|uniref:hypothetical protein n=1 Tax=Amycolatopsis sp. NPDC005232 TaxID=3157027 RepID=UPI0033BB09BC